MKGFTEILKDKTIVISGGTKGVGRGLAIECAKQGARVVIGGRDQTAAEAVLVEINSMNGEAEFVLTDLQNVDDCVGMFQHAISVFGKVDGFVNYAGVTSVGSVEDCHESVFDNIFDVNFKAAFFCVQQAIQHMRQCQGGSIVLVGSPHAWGGDKDRAAYAFSKSALFSLSDHVAHHYAKDGVRCNYFTMGWTPTEGEIALREEQGMTLNELHDMASSVIPVGEMNTIEDSIPALIYLLSDYSKAVSGSNLRATGGLYI